MKQCLAIWMVVALTTIAPAQHERTARIVFPVVGDNGVILLDGHRINPSAGDTIVVDAGLHTIEQVIGNRFRWTIHRIIDTLDLRAGEVVVAGALTGAEHLIASHPEGAEVYRNGTLLGVTPFLYRHSDRVEGTVSLRKDGFETKVISPSRAQEMVFLIRESEEEATESQSVRAIEPSINNRTWTIASAVAMIGSSVAAAYLKQKANNALAEYQRTGSSEALEDVRRFDNYSAVAAASMVISFSGFALFLTIE